MNRTFHENAQVGPALPATALVAGAGGVNAPATHYIKDPHKYGEQLAILLNCPILTGVTGFNARLEGSNDAGVTWSPVKQNDGVTDLAFTGAKFLAGGAYANNVAVGTIIPTRGKYKWYRLGNITVTGAALTISAVYVITPVREMDPVKFPLRVDEFLNKFLPTGS
jgi:hypothetical protein